MILKIALNLNNKIPKDPMPISMFTELPSGGISEAINNLNKYNKPIPLIPSTTSKKLDITNLFNESDKEKIYNWFNNTKKDSLVIKVDLNQNLEDILKISINNNKVELDAIRGKYIKLNPKDIKSITNIRLLPTSSIFMGSKNYYILKIIPI